VEKTSTAVDEISTASNAPSSVEPPASSIAPSTDNENPEAPGANAPGLRVSDEADNVVAFPVKSKRGRPKKSGDDPRVSVEQVSKHTYAVRIRWMRADGVEDGVVVNRLRDDIVKEIKRSKKRYEQFKVQTLSSWKPGTVRTSDQVGADTIGPV